MSPRRFRRGGWNIKYEVRLSGPSVRGARIAAARLKVLIEVLTDGTQKALRLRMDGRSTVKGPVPSWLKSATAFDVVGLRKGSTVLQLEVEPLAKCSPDRFAQGDLFSDIDPSRTSLGLFSESLRDAVRVREDSDLYDAELIETFVKFEGLLGDGVEHVDLVGEGSLSIGGPDVEKLRQLRRQTPPAQRVRLAGKLDSIRHSDRMFTLVLRSGQTLRGVAGEVSPDQLATLFGHDAVVSGTAVFRPAGSVLRIEADAIEAPVGDTSVWSRLPVPSSAGLDDRTLRRPQGPRSGVNAIVGRWPGDESEEEFKDLLARFS